jgi:hypothetical protein
MPAKEVVEMMTNQDVLNLTNTMPVIWFTAYTVLMLGTIALSTSLKGLGLGGNYYYAAPGTVATIALTSALLVASTMQTSLSTKTIKDEMLKQARILGFVAARNMEFCMAGFVLDAVTFATKIASTETLLNKAIGMLDVLEPAIIFLLVKCMQQAFLPAILRVTDPNTANEKGEDTALFTAETGFYTKIGKVLLNLALTKLMTPYLMRVYEIVKARYFG